MSSDIMKLGHFYRFIGEVTDNTNYVVQGHFDGGVSISGFVSPDGSELTYGFNIEAYRNYTWMFLPNHTSLGLYKRASIQDLPSVLSETMGKYGYNYLPLNRQTKSKRKYKSRIKKDIKKLIKDIKKSD